MTCTFENLTQLQKYYIKVEAVNDFGKDTKYAETTTLEVPLSEGNITFNLSETTWTKNDLTATAVVNSKIDMTDYKLQTSIDGKTWEDKVTRTFKTNGTIYARIVDSTEQYNGSASRAITIIDKLCPTISNFTLTPSGNSITAKVTASDKEATKEYGCSGIKNYKYYYRGVTIDETSYNISSDFYNTSTILTTSSSYTISNLYRNATYEVWATVYDNAGNEVSTGEPKEVKTTSSVYTSTLTPDASTPVTITISPTGWSKSKTVTVSTLGNGYKTMYTIDGSIPSATNGLSSPNPFNLEKNTTIYAAYINPVNNSVSLQSNTITTIDTVKPTISTALSSSSVTSSGFTLNIGVTDTTSGLGKIEWYYKLSSASSYTSVTDTYTTLNGLSTGTTSVTTKSRTFNGLTSGVYTTYAIVYDVAGNATQSSTITIATGATGATASPTSWTNGKVTITLPSTSNMQYQIGSTTGTWSTYSSPFTVSSNTTVYYRYYSGSTAGQYASIVVTNIDTVVPTISTALSSSNVTTSGFTLNIGVTDANSGLGKIEWYYKLSSASSYTSVTDTYTTLNGSSTGTTSATTKTRTITGLTTGTYNAYTKVYDVAGNATQSSTITIEVEPTIDNWKIWATKAGLNYTDYTNIVDLLYKESATLAASTEAVDYMMLSDDSYHCIRSHVLTYYEYQYSTNGIVIRPAFCPLTTILSNKYAKNSILDNATWRQMILDYKEYADVDTYEYPLIDAIINANLHETITGSSTITTDCTNVASNITISEQGQFTKTANSGDLILKVQSKLSYNSGTTTDPYVYTYILKDSTNVIERSESSLGNHISDSTASVFGYYRNTDQGANKIRARLRQAIVSGNSTTTINKMTLTCKALVLRKSQ